ncbi:MAG: GFA family protein [Betaproteobacteria bacterium]|nr:GFA family protein [Betaproteobacteria bacterium]
MQGECLCKSIQYHCNQPPVYQLKCHCRDCQKVSGGPYAPIALFPVEAVKIEGEVKYFESYGESGKRIWRGFCPQCGSQLFGKLERFPNLIGIRAGTLDEPNEFDPKVNIYASHAPSWDSVDTTLLTFPLGAPQT